MLLPKYKYYVNSVEVHPLFNKLSKKYEKESNEYFFREKIEGSIKLIGTDFRLIASASIEQDLTFSIFKLDKKTNTFKEYYTSKFNKTDCTFNYDTKACTLKLEKNDKYSALMDKYENTIDLLKYGVKPTRISITKRGIIQTYLVNSSVLTNFLGGGIYWEQNCESIGNPEELIQKYHFAQSCSLHNIDLYTTNVSGTVGAETKTASYLSVAHRTYADFPWWQANNIYVELVYYSSLDTEHYLKLYVNAKSGNIENIKSDAGIYKKNGNVQTHRIKSVSTDIPDEYKKEKYLNKAILEEINPVGLAVNTITLYADPIEYVYSRLLCDVPDVNGKDTYEIPIEDIVENSSNYKRVIPYDFEEITASNNFTTEVTPYGNNSEGEFYLPPASSYGQKFFPINRSMWYDTYSVWFNFSSTYPDIDRETRKTYILRDGYFIADVIKTLLTQLAPDIKHEATTEYSRFLYDTEDPLGLNKFYLFLAPKSNILKGEYDRPAQKAEIALKELMEMLWACFKLRWFIDDQNRLRIEHISWFLNGGSYDSFNRQVQIDLTDEYDNRNLKALSKFQNEIEYDKSELASRFEFGWMDDCTEVFEGTPINVISKYVEASKIESISPSKFTPDIDYMLAEPSAFSQDGFALLCATKHEQFEQYALPFVSFTLKGPVEQEAAYQVILQNGFASWLHLIEYYMYDMPGASLKYDYLNGTLQVKAIMRSMQQSIEFPREEDPDTYGLIKTERGEGVIEDMTINMINQQVKVTLNFTPS